MHGLDRRKQNALQHNWRSRNEFMREGRQTGYKDKQYERNDTRMCVIG